VSFLGGATNHCPGVALFEIITLEALPPHEVTTLEALLLETCTSDKLTASVNHLTMVLSQVSTPYSLVFIEL
jgi:hypothetical protein